MTTMIIAFRQSCANKFIPSSTIHLCLSSVKNSNNPRSFLFSSKNSRCQLSSLSSATTSRFANNRSEKANIIDSTHTNIHTHSITKRSIPFIVNKNRNKEKLSLHSKTETYSMNVKQNQTNTNKNFEASTNHIQFPIFYNDVYEVNLPPHHRFPMKKYRQVRERVQKAISLNTETKKKDVVSGELKISHFCMKFFFIVLCHQSS